MDAHLAPDIRCGQPLAILLHKDHGHAPVTGPAFGIRLAEHHVKSGEPAVGDKGFGTVDDPVVPVLLCHGVHSGDVRPMIRFGKSPGREHVAFRHRDEKFFFKGFTAESQNTFGCKPGKDHRASDG